MDTRSTADLKKAVEGLEAEKRAMAEQLAALQQQVRELSINRDEEGENGTDCQQRHKGKSEATRTFNKATTPTKVPPTPKGPTIPDPDKTNSRAPRICFWCQGLGHIASDCPNKRMVTLTEFEDLEHTFATVPSTELQAAQGLDPPDPGPIDSVAPKLDPHNLGSLWISCVQCHSTPNDG
ncbi:hypothetical protein E3N88_17195 [Mikania micrantha]|uniref:CCHC-type domain-containing protein n=1 Tax=Mikania micrantha TaxID=192012 RepID=A0A5N6NSJ9_9ASTR|nr:hypothetical protein E3N88_17195 [Mikania micrantha]